MGLEAPGERDDEEGGESERAGTHATSASLRLATTSYSRKEEGRERGKVGWGEKNPRANDSNHDLQRSGEVEVRGLVKFAPALV